MDQDTSTISVTNMQNLEYKLPFAAIKILSESDASDLVAAEPKKWNVVSIWSGGGGKHGWSRPLHRGSKSMCQKRFHDITSEEKGLILCNKWHIETILDYCRKLYNTDEPIIYHCFAGISRSSAFCYITLLDWLKDKSENPVEDALNLLIKIKDWNLIYPNKYIVGLGIHMLAKDAGQEMEWNRIFYNSRITAKIYG